MSVHFFSLKANLVIKPGLIVSQLGFKTNQLCLRAYHAGLKASQSPICSVKLYGRISLLEISEIKKNIPKLDFCKDTPIEPRKRVVRLVGPNFGTPGFGATFYAKKCYFWPFFATISAPIFSFFGVQVGCPCKNPASVYFFSF